MAGRRLVAAGRHRRRARGETDSATCWTARRRRCRIRGRAASRTGCTGCPGHSMPGLTLARPGLGLPGWAGWSRICISARSPPRGRWMQPPASSTTWRTRRGLRGAAAGQWIQRNTQLGLRRRARFAVQESYGGPAGYQRFVDAAHADGHRRHPGRGLQPPRAQRKLPAAVRAVPEAAASAHLGDSVNLAGRAGTRCAASSWTTRQMWSRDYHVDGLRLDAVHALRDERAAHILEEIACGSTDISG